jgi:hypothetical protein
MHLPQKLVSDGVRRNGLVQVSAVVQNNSNFVHVRKHDELWKAPPSRAVEGRCFPTTASPPLASTTELKKTTHFCLLLRLLLGENCFPFQCSTCKSFSSSLCNVVATPLLHCCCEGSSLVLGSSLTFSTKFLELNQPHTLRITQVRSLKTLENSRTFRVLKLQCKDMYYIYIYIITSLTTASHVNFD